METKDNKQLKDNELEDVNGGKTNPGLKDFAVFSHQFTDLNTNAVLHKANGVVLIAEDEQPRVIGGIHEVQ